MAAVQKSSVNLFLSQSQTYGVKLMGAGNKITIVGVQTAYAKGRVEVQRVIEGAYPNIGGANVKPGENAKSIARDLKRSLSSNGYSAKVTCRSAASCTLDVLEK